jgi:hypothetical protein
VSGESAHIVRAKMKESDVVLAESVHRACLLESFDGEKCTPAKIFY